MLRHLAALALAFIAASLSSVVVAQQLPVGTLEATLAPGPAPESLHVRWAHSPTTGFTVLSYSVVLRLDDDGTPGSIVHSTIVTAPVATLAYDYPDLRAFGGYFPTNAYHVSVCAVYRAPLPADEGTPPVDECGSDGPVSAGARRPLSDVLANPSFRSIDLRWTVRGALTPDDGIQVLHREVPAASAIEPPADWLVNLVPITAVSVPTSYTIGGLAPRTTYRILVCVAPEGVVEPAPETECVGPRAGDVTTETPAPPPPPPVADPDFEVPVTTGLSLLSRAHFASTSRALSARFGPGRPARADLARAPVSEPFHAGSLDPSLGLGRADAVTRPSWAAWVRAGNGSFAAEENAVAYDGDSRHVHFGVENGFSFPGGYRSHLSTWVAGVGVGALNADLSYVRGADRDVRGGATIESDLWLVYPYFGFSSARRSGYVSMGYGSGDIRVRDDQYEMLDVASSIDGDQSALFAAGGLGFALLPDDSAYASNLLFDVSYGRMTHDPIGDIAKFSQGLGSARAAFDLSSSFRAGAAVLTPILGVGLLYDFGDGVTGAGYDASAGLELQAGPVLIAGTAVAQGMFSSDVDPSAGFALQARLAPGLGGRGLSLSLSPNYEAAPGDAPRTRARMAAEVGYGLRPTGTRGLLTPYATYAGGSGLDPAYTVGVRYRVARLWSMVFSARSPRGVESSQLRVLARVHF